MINLRSWLEKQSPEEREHFLREIPRLFLEGGQIQKLYSLLSNYDFIEAKINHPDFGVQELIEDYNLIDNAEFSNHPDYNAEIVKSLNLIPNALFRSTPILIADKKQLAGQLSGRLLHFQELDVIKKLLQQISQSKTTCLRCLTASLTPPGIPLIRTLTGHSDSVNAAGFSRDLFSRKRSPDHPHSPSPILPLSIFSRIRLLIIGLGGNPSSVGAFRDAVKSHVNAVAVTGDGKYAVSGSDDEKLKVWELATGRKIRTLKGHSDSVNAVAVTGDGKYAISASDDTTLKVWELATGQKIATFTGEDSIDCCAVAPDGVTIAAGDESGKVHFLRLQGIEVQS